MLLCDLKSNGSLRYHFIHQLFVILLGIKIAISIVLVKGVQDVLWNGNVLMSFLYEQIQKCKYLHMEGIELDVVRDSDDSNSKLDQGMH